MEMQVTKVEVKQSTKVITLPEAYLPAWREPDGVPMRSFTFSYCKVYTDEGIIGYGPYSGNPDAYVLSAVIGLNPFYTEKFWNACMVGRELPFNRGNYSGIEVALWDIVGKALRQPVYKILGACRDRILAYAATNRLLRPEDHVKQVTFLRDQGFKAVKLRLHRPNPKKDLAVIQSVREAVGDDLMILVDANQNNRSVSYNYWSRKTAIQMAKALDKLDVFFLEEPLPRRDREGLAEIAQSVDMFIAGGEHSTNIYEFHDHLITGAYDIIQPDIRLGDFGITGLRKTAFMADLYSRQVVPHVSSTGNVALSLPATLQAVATFQNCPMVEYPYDPPLLTENQQAIIKQPISIDSDGYLPIPDRPGIGIELVDEET